MTPSSLIRQPRALLASLALTRCFLAAPAVALAQASAPAAAMPVASDPTAGADAPVVSANNTVKETVDNPYGLGALWAQGDFVARGTLMILFLMSLGSWYILITKLFEYKYVAEVLAGAQRLAVTKLGMVGNEQFVQ